jgi:competence protein ComEC
MRKVIYITLILAVFTVSAFIGYAFFKSDFNGLNVAFLDVGQGDSVFIRPSSGQNILIDGGPDSKVLHELPNHMKWWDRTIDLMILTHPHDDHLVGFIEVAKRYKVKKAIYFGVAGDSPVYEAWKNILIEKNIPIMIADDPQMIFLDDDCYLKIIPGAMRSDLNNSSLVSLLDCENVRFLFTGDIEKKAEDVFLTLGEDLSADVVKAAHHGSDTSSSEAFLDMIQPKYAVISAGRENKFGHPSLRVLSRFERRGVAIFRTDEDGSILFQVAGGRVDVLK